jgi:quercetin dioxygenase-like cupin family protein
MLRYYSWDDLQADTETKNLLRKFVSGERLTIARTETEKGSRLTSRRHPHETFIAVIYGAWKVSFGGKELVIGPNQILHIPPNAEHRIESLDRTLALEVFSAGGWMPVPGLDAPPMAEDDDYLWGV